MVEVNEIWKDIDGYEKYYQVSNLGRVRSLTRHTRSIVGIDYVYTGKIMSLNKTDRGYLMAKLSKNCAQKTIRVNRLVAQAFILNNGNKPHVNHKDGNRSNNYVSNLEWVTHSENILHSFRVLGRKGMVGEKNPKSKPIVVEFPDGTLKRVASARQAAIELKIDPSGICQMLKGKFKQYLGYKFKYVV